MTKFKKPNAALLNHFAKITGDKYAIFDRADMGRYLDEPRKKFHGIAAMVLKPGSVDEVSAILKLASETGTAIVPQGGNTGVVGGQVPDASGAQIILSLERLNRVRQVSPDENAMIVEAGVTLLNAQNAALEAGKLFPLSLASEGSCMIGGNLATNAGGVNVVAYGNMRDLCLGLEVVLADGQVLNGLNSLRKNNTGIDLKNLFIGSEGILGIITAATLKLFEIPNHKATAYCAITEPDKALQLLQLAQKISGGRVTSIELMPRIALDLVCKYQNMRDPMAEPSAWYALLEISTAEPFDMENLLEKAFEADIITDAVLAQSETQAIELWKLRELISESQSPEGGSIKHDIAVPVHRTPEFLARATKAVTDLIPGARPVPFGHVGDGNIHFNITQPVGADKSEFLSRWAEVNAVVHAIVLDMGGSVSAEHGIGQLKRDLMPQIKTPVELALMRKMKTALDPENILNPGKML